MKLTNATDTLISSRNAAYFLRLADKYMAVYRTDKKRFALVKEHRFLEPVIKYYAPRAKGFAAYILRVRDNYPRGTAEYDALNKLYRTVFTRAVQQERRARADAAVALAEKAYGPPPSFSERLSWIARREADWARQRRDYLSAERQKAGGKLSRDETNDRLAEFWSEIDADIAAGVPPWGE